MRFGGVCPRVVVVQQYGELIPAEPGHQAVWRCMLQQTLSHAGEQRVAYGVPQAVIDGFEMVQIQQ